SPVVLLSSCWNSLPIRRMVATTLPSRFITTGKSFGPMTTSATTPINSISVQPTPNMKVLSLCQRQRRSGVLLLGRRRGSLHLGRSAHGLGLVFVAHALLEGFDPGGELTHGPRDLAAAEEQHDHDGNDNDAPKSWTVHRKLLFTRAWKVRSQIGGNHCEHKDSVAASVIPWARPVPRYRRGRADPRPRAKARRTAAESAGWAATGC